MSSQATTANKALVRRWYEAVWNQGDLTAADEILAEAESVKRYIKAFRAAFPDIQHTILAMIAEGDTVVTHFSARGAHTGQWHSIPPTGKEIAYQGVTLAQIEHDQIIQHQTIWDKLTVLEQLGLAPLIRKADGSRL